MNSMDLKALQIFKIEIYERCIFYNRNQKGGKTCLSFLTGTTLEKCGFEQQKEGMIIFTNPSARAGYDTRSIFKRSLTGLNSEFSFS